MVLSPANAEEGPTTPADPAPFSSAGIDLRDNQLDELSGSVAPGSAASSDSLEGATVVSWVDSLEGAMVVSQEQAPVSQSILAELNVPNLSDSCDAPNSNDCSDLSNSIDLFNERNETSIVTLNNNGTSTANNNINNESEIHSNDSSGNNGNSESIMHSNDSSENNGNSESINVTFRNNNGMVLDCSSDSDADGSDDPEIRSNASIASLDADGSSLDSVHSVDNEGFVVPLP